MSDPEPFDPRLTPARPDLAAEFLRGLIQAKHYAEPRDMQVCISLAQMYGAPDDSTMLQTELLLGESFAVYENKDGWVWGQVKRDGYVGYVRSSAFGVRAQKPDHRISAIRTPIFARPDLKAPLRGYAHGNSVFACMGKEGDYLKMEPDLGWVFAKHTVALDSYEPDWVSNAERYENTPYVWGGRSSFGLDCSALVQNALQAGGILARRDTDMQESALGESVDIAKDLSGLCRGDLVFWKGHVGIMLDAHILLHANAHHMAVVREPLREAAVRIQKTAEAITAIRRFSVNV